MRQLRKAENKGNTKRNARRKHASCTFGTSYRVSQKHEIHKIEPGDDERTKDMGKYMAQSSGEV